MLNIIEMARTRPEENVTKYRNNQNEQLADGFLSNIWQNITSGDGVLPTVNVEYEMSKKDRTMIYTGVTILAVGMIGAALIKK